MNTYAWSPRYDAALTFAARAHRNQVRKGSDTPYVAHVVAVSVILLRHGFDEELAIAGLLHDAVEDCGIAIESIQSQFGERVAQLVAAVTEQKSVDGVPLPWEQRKADKLLHLREGGPEVAVLKAADAIHNARSIATDVQRDGPAVWQRFKGSRQQTCWYYNEIAAGVRQWLGEHPIAQELNDAVATLSALA